MIKINGSDGITYIVDGDRYWPEEALKEALGCKDDDIFGAIKKLKEAAGVAINTPGMKIGNEDPVDLDIFDNPRYRFLSILSSELGFRTIVGPGNAEKTEDDILRIIKYRDDELKNFRSHQIDEEGEEEARKEFLRKLRCELGVPMPVVKGSRKEMEEDILERIWKLKEGNWPCENGNTFAEHMRKQFPKECKKWSVRPLDNGSVHDWVQYIFGELDGWRNRALKDEEERDKVYEALGLNPADDDVDDVVAAIKKLREDRAKYKGMLNTWYGASCGGDLIDVLPCYRDTCNNPKATRERDAANDALAELRAKIREVYREAFGCSMEIDYGNTSALNDILKEFKFQKKLKEKAEEKAASNKMELRQCRAYILEIYREIFDCSNGDPEGSDKETLNDILEEYRNVYRVLEDKCKDYDNLEALYKSSLKLLGEYLTEAKDILGIDSCDKDTVASAIRALKSAYNSLRNDHDEVCEGYTKLKKDYDELGEAHSSVLKWNNSYADVRRLLEVPADADAGVMVGALNKFMCDYEKLKEEYEKAKCNTDYFREFEKSCSERQAFIFKLCEALDVDKDGIGSFFDDEEAAILKAIDEHHEATANAAANEQVGVDAFRNECRKLKAEKAKVIEALGQDIWDDCVK